MGPKKILICGGHLSPALALIEKLKENKLYQIIYIGRKFALEGDKTISLEYRTIINLKIPFFTITTGRFQRFISPWFFVSLFKIPIGLIQSFVILLRVRPDLVISFGGYLSLPVCINAWLLKIPILIHEQTPIMGLSNRLIAKLSKAVCLSWPETKYVPGNTRIYLTGIPVRKSIIDPINSSILDFGDRNCPLIYITGGSLGAQSINKIIGEVLPQLVRHYRIIHQSGRAQNERDYKNLQKIKSALPNKTKKNYKLVKLIDPDEIGNILHHADLLISRSGANTVAEIACNGIPAILIPLPWAANNEQESNASILEKYGLAQIVKQSELNPKSLLTAIEKNIGKKSQSNFRRNTEYKFIATQSVSKMTEVISSLLSMIDLNNEKSQTFFFL
ncbi:hypothetical protein A2960_01180 [Candidatus Gottesmanbacteria bacterium RIFCSPLOWO2_01_FULL_39_12b]|uniref:UDP-N-acetylglucosamine--N-acetylmuramyl-(pentapeptide) pyrophosphoryl-undecaprenol N-acetylglucosamine transferase n=1 Tax=Candidatus Gottesmanbacteria bacterium RIFCSPLOWO2_01_FULL_39_12b TaxID=1798388 RepID=A0A1F6AQ27_9BACT|nr:MAG: hypothetical protein A2960_01180 [Candidatus Gottesmanbacteria bacterium RIFCSPLOWO2_01_FULL_39_12b]